MQSALKFLIAGIALVFVVGLGAMVYVLFWAEAPETADSSQATGSGCAISAPASGFTSGQYVFRLSKDVFQPSPSLDKEIQARYGANVNLADWDQLKSILGSQDEVRKFIDSTGVRLQTTNYDCDNVLVSRAGQETVQDRHYHFARHDGKTPPNWSVLDSIGANDIHLGRWNHAGQALLRISKAQ